MNLPTSRRLPPYIHFVWNPINLSRKLSNGTPISATRNSYQLIKETLSAYQCALTSSASIVPVLVTLISYLINGAAAASSVCEGKIRPASFVA